MTVVEIDEEELSALRQQAAMSIPWQSEAQRLAEALRSVAPDHEMLTADVWAVYFDKIKKTYSPVEPPHGQ